MSAEFTTSLEVNGTKKECLEIMKVLFYYANDRKKQYEEKRDCWYLDESFDSPEEELKGKWKSGRMNMILSGPYGIMDGPVGDSIDLFERIADAAPSCCFSGSIEGWDSGGDQSLAAELKDGLLFLKSSYSEYGKEWGDDEEEIDEDESNGDAWDTIYDPKTKSYKNASTIDGDSVIVTISLFDEDGRSHVLSLLSDDIEYPIGFTFFPEVFLGDNSTERVLNLIHETIYGSGKQQYREKITEFKTELTTKLQIKKLSKLKLEKIHNHKKQLFFSLFKSKTFNPDLKVLAKKVCTCSEKNRHKNIKAFEQYLEDYIPGWPDCGYSGWPSLCKYRHEIAKLDWSCLAETTEELAHIICSREKPNDYAVETVIVDFNTGIIAQTAVYMPGGPEKKNSEKMDQSNDEEISSNSNSDSTGTSTKCDGLSFVITGKVSVFKNRDEFTNYVKSQGGKVSGTVSKNTDYLVNNDLESNSSKNIKAKELGVQIISENDFIDMFGQP